MPSRDSTTLAMIERQLEKLIQDTNMFSRNSARRKYCTVTNIALAMFSFGALLCFTFDGTPTLLSSPNPMGHRRLPVMIPSWSDWSSVPEKSWWSESWSPIAEGLSTVANVIAGGLSTAANLVKSKLNEVTGAPAPRYNLSD